MPASVPDLPVIAPLIPRLEVIDADDRRSIFLNGHLTARYHCDDKATERMLVTQLCESPSSSRPPNRSRLRFAPGDGEPLSRRVPQW
jgi:hypothetical protein